jgi:FlaA1/EpsC-like NDP-sugar epimerase
MFRDQHARNTAYTAFRPVICLAIVGTLAAASYVTAFLLRFAGDVPAWASTTLWSTLAVAVAAKIAAARRFHVHRGWSRYVSFHDLVALAKAVTCASIGLTLVDALVITSLAIPRSVVLLDWGASLVLLAAIRSLPRFVRDAMWNLAADRTGVRTLIVGAGDAGEALVRALRTNPKLAYRPVGFIDDSRRVGELLGGTPVIGRIADLAAVARDQRIEEVLIAGDLAGRTVRNILDQASTGGFRVKVVPSYEQLLGDRVEVQTRPVAIADLLGRESVELDDAEVRGWLRDRTVLVTGSAGSIGSEICRKLLKLAPRRLVLVDRSETGQFFLERELCQLDPAAPLEVILADVNDLDRMHSIFDQWRPDVIFHAAAYKHVPLMEAHVAEAVKNIVLATRGLANLADEFGAQSFVMVSTDKAVNPTSVMGSCKRLAEEYVQAQAGSSACRFVTVRFGNVLDSAGSVAPIFREQIARGGPVTVTHPDMVRYFMLIPEAAQLVIQAGAMGRGGEIFVLDMGEPVRILDLARDMVRLSGLRVGDDIEIRITGLRPGEKLFEELYDRRESHLPTPHPKIMAATGAPRSLLHVIHDIGRLEETLSAPNDALRSLLREIIPTHNETQKAQAHPRRRLAA